jgi:metal-responsive CopG/Arc/MetJ family transcriptional regulator
VRVTTSVTLPRDVLDEIDCADSNRSSFLERAARQYLDQIKKARRAAKDAAILDAHAKRLNAEALDVLEYQNLD